MGAGLRHGIDSRGKELEPCPYVNEQAAGSCPPMGAADKIAIALEEALFRE